METENAKIMTLIQARRDELYALVNEIVAPFWTAHYAHRKAGDNVGVYGIRVRQGKVGISAHWYHVRFVQRPDGGWRAFSDHIDLGPGRYRYGAHQVPRMQSWEKALFTDVEDQLEPIRRSSAALVSIVKSLRADEKRLAKLFEVHPELGAAADFVAQHASTEGLDDG